MSFIEIVVLNWSNNDNTRKHDIKQDTTGTSSR